LQTIAAFVITLVALLAVLGHEGLLPFAVSDGKFAASKPSLSLPSWNLGVCSAEDFPVCFTHMKCTMLMHFCNAGCAFIMLSYVSGVTHSL